MIVQSCISNVNAAMKLNYEIRKERDESMTNQITINCKFQSGDVVFFRSEAQGVSYMFGTIKDIHSMEKAAYSKAFTPVYEIKKYGGGTAFVSEGHLTTVEKFILIVKEEQAKAAKDNQAILDEVAPPPPKREEIF